MECSAADRFCFRDLSFVRAIVWTIPPCYIKDRVQDLYRYYVLPTGMWQWWAIFAPDPVRNTTMLDAEIVDAKGMRHIFEFPRIAELTLVAKDSAVSSAQVHGQHGDPEYTRAEEVHGPSCGAADGPEARGVSPVR